MDPTLKDQDRLVVNKLAYQIGEPQPGDVVMLRYPIDPDKSFVKRNSRIFGFVPKKYIIAKVQLRWWPLSAATLF